MVNRPTNKMYKYSYPTPGAKLYYGTVKGGAEPSLADADFTVRDEPNSYKGIHAILFSQQHPTRLFVVSSSEQEVATLLKVDRKDLFPMRLDCLELLNAARAFDVGAWVSVPMKGFRTFGFVYDTRLSDEGKVRVFILPVDMHGKFVEMTAAIAKKTWPDAVITEDGEEYTVMREGVLREFRGGLVLETVQVGQLEQMPRDLSNPEFFVFYRAFEDEADAAEWILAKHKRRDFHLSSYNLPPLFKAIKVLSGPLQGHVVKYLGPTIDSLTHIDIRLKEGLSASIPVHYAQMTPEIMDRVQFWPADGSKGYGWVVNFSPSGQYIVRSDKTPGILLPFSLSHLELVETVLSEEDIDQL